MNCKKWLDEFLGAQQDERTEGSERQDLGWVLKSARLDWNNNNRSVQDNVSL